MDKKDSAFVDRMVKHGAAGVPADFPTSMLSSSGRTVLTGKGKSLKRKKASQNMKGTLSKFLNDGEKKKKTSPALPSSMRSK